MRYKTVKQENEFNGDALDNRLRMILYAMDGYSKTEFGVDLYITEVIRTHEENIRIYVERGVPEAEVKASVHQYGRGADCRAWILESEQASQLVRWTNKNFKYKGRPATALLHKVGNGMNHIHVQVDNEEIITIKK